MQEIIKICFVCTGNTCRSFMAERLMKKKLKDEDVGFVKVISRGFEATGEMSTPNACKALKMLGASSAKRKSVKLKKFDQKILYVAMTSNQKAKVNGKVIEIKDLVGQEVPDPYGKTLEDYVQCAQLLSLACDKLTEKIKAIGGSV